MKRSKFSLSHYRNLTCGMGEMVPIGLVEVLPGDTFQQATTALVRTTPLVAPVMHPCHINIWHIFIPNRLVWDNSGGADTGWEAFITGGPSGTSTPTFPTITVNSGSGFAVGSLADYLGVPTGVDDLPCSAIPFRGYALAWNELFRDQDLDTALTIDKTDGADTTTNQTLQTVSWEKDYFTTARPWTQKGTAVSLPLGTSAVVKTSGSELFAGSQIPLRMNRADTGGAPTAGRSVIIGSANDNIDYATTGLTGSDANLYPKNLYADLQGATASTINDLREAWQLQKYKEARAMFGSRYTEWLAYYGVRSSDARLQRPELLATGRQTIQFSEVLQQSPTTSGTPNTGLGTMGGHGLGITRSNRYRRFFEEHGYVLSIMAVRPKTMYVTGLSKTWSRTSKEDFWTKELEGIGQEEVYNKELYWADTGPNDVFGYQRRYDSYRRQESSVHGDFRGATLDDWHLGRIFTSDVTLNAAFVNCTPSTRIFQSTSTDPLLVMAHHSIQARRLVGKTGIPSGI